MRHAPKSTKTMPVEGLEGCYIKIRQPAVRFTLKDGRYEWGTRFVFDRGTYTSVQPNEFSCMVELSSEVLKDWERRCSLIRRGKTYTINESPDGAQGKYKRDDDVL